MLRFLLILPLLGCSITNDTDDFEPDELCAWELKPRDFSPHTNNRFEARLVQQRPDSLNLMGRIVIDPLIHPDIDIRIPDAVPPLLTLDFNRPYIDFYADLNNNREYDQPPVDHTWRLEDACTTGPELFPHNTNFLDLPSPIPVGGDLRIRTCGMEIMGDVAIEVRVRILGQRPPLPDLEIPSRLADRAGVGMYRLHSLRQLLDEDPEDRVLVLEGIIGDIGDYEVDVLIDANRNFIHEEDELAFRYVFPAETARTCGTLLAAQCIDPMRMGDPIQGCRTMDGRDAVITVSPDHDDNILQVVEEESWATPVN